jgi:hypothetical protein
LVVNPMNPEYEKQLEAGVRRELDALGELTAPTALANRILRAVEARAHIPWYHRAWSAWPLTLRLAFLALLLTLFGGVCYAAWQITNGVPAWAGPRPWEGWMADAAALWRTLGVLANTAGNLLGRLGAGVITAGLVTIFATWAAGIALGTAYVRLALRLSVKRI